VKFATLIPDSIIRQLGEKLLENEEMFPKATVYGEDFILGVRNNIVIVSTKGKSEAKPFWCLPEPQSSFIYISLMRWMCSAEDFYPCLLGTEKTDEGTIDKWGEAEA